MKMKTYFYLAFCMYLTTTACVVLMTESAKRKCEKVAIGAIRTTLNVSLIAVKFETVSLMGCANFCNWASRLELRKSFYILQNHGRCRCKNATEEADEGQEEPEVAYGASQPGNENETHPDRSHKLDCLANWKKGRYFDDGIYTIRPSENVPIKDVYCSIMFGILMQARSGDDQMFKRNWSEYVHGFGDIAEDEDDIHEYWLGLEYIHHLTRNGSQLFIRIEDNLSVETDCWLDYSDFTVGDSSSEYTLNVSGFDETVFFSHCGDSMSSHSGLPFSAPRGETGCADACAGGWWYPDNTSCGQSGLNSAATESDSYTCHYWATSEWMEKRKSDVRSKMFIFPRN